MIYNYPNLIIKNYSDSHYINTIQQVAISPTSANWTTWNRITDISKNVENIVRLQRKLCKNKGEHADAGGSDREKAIEEFHAWLMKEHGPNGADPPGTGAVDAAAANADEGGAKKGIKWKIQDRGTKTGFGVVATEKIAKGETIIRVPTSIAITTDTALEDKDLGPNIVQDQFLRQKPSLILALYLLFEKLKGKRSALPVHKVVACNV